MGRRKGELTLLMEVASKWPWKVPATLVPLSYLACHFIAEAFASVTVQVSPAGLGQVVIRQGIHAFATFFQYILPVIFFAAAVVSFIRRSRSIALFDDVSSESAVNVADLSWGDFERLVGEGFRRRGFEVAGGGGPDGGVDLTLAGMSDSWCNVSNGGRGRLAFRWSASYTGLWRLREQPAGTW
jgi:restriction system protein